MVATPERMVEKRIVVMCRLKLSEESESSVQISKYTADYALVMCEVTVSKRVRAQREGVGARGKKEGKKERKEPYISQGKYR